VEDLNSPSALGTPATRPRGAGNSSPGNHGMVSKPVPVSETQAQEARKPVGAPLRLSRQVGLLLRTAEIFGLSVWQERHLRRLSLNLDPQGIQAAAAYADYLRSHPQTYQSLRTWVVYLSRPIHGKKEVLRRPKRQMGVGYRDKGTKPDPSTRARIEANYFAWIYEPDLPKSWWKQYGMIPLYALREGEWVLFPREGSGLSGR